MLKYPPKSQFDDVVNFACRELPPEWELVLRMEKGCADWRLTTPRGDDVCGVDEGPTPVDTLRRLVEVAKTWTCTNSK